MPSQLELTRQRVLSEIEEATQKRRALEVQLVSLQHLLELLAVPAKPDAVRPRAKPGSVEQKVRQVFAARPGMIAIDALIAESGCAASSVRAVLRRYAAAGVLTCSADGGYSLAAPTATLIPTSAVSVLAS